jgi:hypothetical protein
MKVERVAAVLLGLAAPVALTVACGARSGLLSIPDFDAMVGADAALVEDVVLPGLDVSRHDVVQLSVCADAGDTLIYTVTEQNHLLRFDPTSSGFTPIGTLACPDPYGRSPYSMAVDRQGNAYVLYYTSGGSQAGSIFKVNLNTAACASTSYVPGQQGFLGFGMGFASNDVGVGETLYVATTGGTTSGLLGAIDEKTLTLSLVGTLPVYALGAELTGTGDGRLFAFYNPSYATNQPNNDQPTYIGQINKTTAAVFAQAGPFDQVQQGAGWAFGFWGGNFYMFTSPDTQTAVVQRYNPTDGSVTQVATYPEIIVGAGVSTCAPVQ